MRHYNNRTTTPLSVAVAPIKTITTTALLSISVLLTACGGSDYDFNKETTPPITAALPHGPIFDPANSKIPSTNDLLFKDSTDGTLNIPNPDNNPVIDAINELDGFSTSVPIVAEFGMALDPASLVIGDSIHVFEVNKTGAAITAVVREVTADEMLAVAVGDKAMTLALVPRVPLKESTSYLVVLTNKIKGTDGKPAKTPSVYALTKGSVPLTGGDYAALEPLRQLSNNMETIAETQSVTKDSIVLSWSFTTQSISAVLNDVAASAKAGKIVVAPTGKNTHDISAAFPGIADVYIGTLDVPYYLKAPSSSNPTAPLTDYWKGAGGTSLTRYNTTPIANSTLATPLMVTMPNANSGLTMPADGWPVIIYQHGITRVRTDMLIYADAMASVGYAVVAMDLPLHGIDTENPFYGVFHASKTPFPTDVEPSFDVDYVNNETGAAGPDGISDESGKHFMNLRSLLTSRDNIRQGVSNLLVLRRSLKNIPNIDASKVGFIAHSLGGIVGVPYLGVEDKSLPTSLVAAGAPIRTILKDSIPFGVDIKNALAAAGITGDAYEKFLIGTQFVLDSADPFNYAIDAGATHPIHMIEIIGDGTATHIPDQVVSNRTTEMLAALIGATSASNIGQNAVTVGGAKIVRFTQGNHSSVLDPTRGGNYLNVFTEIHRQLASFQAASGAGFIITDGSIIKK
nr:carboxylesterase [uncultured Gammaproteobacteria bacterium]